MAQNTQGEISLLIDVNATVSKVNFNLAELQKQIEASVSKLKTVNLTPDIRLEEHKILAGIQKQFEALALKYKDVLSKEFEKVSVKLNIAESLKKAIGEGGVAVDSEGKIVAGKLKALVSELYSTITQGSTGLGIKTSLIKELSAVVGKDAKEAVDILKQFGTQWKAESKNLENNIEVTSKINVRNFNLIDDAIKRSAVEFKEGTSSIQKDVLALAEVMRILNIESGKLNLTGDIPKAIESYKRLSDAAERGKEALIRMAASTANVGEDFSKHEQKIEATLGVLARLRPEYDALIAIQKLENRELNDLEKAEKRYADAQLIQARSAVESTDIQLKAVKELGAALLNLQNIRTAQNKDSSFSGLTDVKGQQRDLEALISIQKAEEKILTDLNTKLKSYAEAQKLVSDAVKAGTTITKDEWDRASVSVKAYSNVLESLRKQTLSPELSSEVQKQINLWEKDALAVRYMIDLHEQLNKVQSSKAKYGNAETPNAQLLALRELQKAYESINHITKEYELILGNLGRAESEAAQHNRVLIASNAESIHSTQTLINETSSLVRENERLGGSYNSLSNAFRSFVRYAVEMAAFYQGLQAVENLAGGIVKLEDALKSIQAIARATDTEMETVSAVIKQVASDTQFSTDEIATAAQTLAQAGIEISKMGEALNSTADLASATGSSLSSAADVLTTVKNVFNDMSFDKISDQLTNTVNLSKLTIEGLSTILSRAIEIADAFNITTAQMNAAFATLRNAGIKDSTISTGFRQALLEVFSPDDKAIKFLEKRYEELGQVMSASAIRQLFQGFAQSGDPIKSVIDELNKLGFSTSAASEFSRVFDVRAQNVLQVLSKQSSEYTRLTAQIDTNGSAAQGATTQMEGLGRSWDNLGSILTATTSNVFTPILGVLEKLVDGLGNFITRVDEAVNSAKELTGSTGVFASIAAGLAGLLGGAAGVGGTLLRGVGFAGLASAISLTLSSFVTEAIGKVNNTLGEWVGKALQAITIGLAGVITVASIGPVISKLTGIITVASGLVVAALAKLGVTAATGAVGAEVGGAMLAAEGAVAVAFYTRIRATLTFAKEAIMKGIGALAAIASTNLYVKGVLLAITAFTIAYETFSDNIDATIDAISKKAARVAKQLDDAKKTQGDTQEDTQKEKGIIDSFNQIAKSRDEFFERATNGVKISSEKLAKAIDDLKGVSTDLQGGQLAKQVEEMARSLGVAFGEGVDLNQIIELINKQAEVITQMEGKRRDMLQKITEALESTDRTEGQKSLIEAYKSLGSKEKEVLSREIKSSVDFQNFLEAKKPFYSAILDLDSKIEGLRIQKLELERREAEKVVEKAKGENDMSIVWAKLIQAQEDGNLELIEAYIGAINTQNDKSKAKLTSDVQGWWSNLVDVISENIRSLWNGSSATKVTPPFAPSGAKENADAQSQISSGVSNAQNRSLELINKRNVEFEQQNDALRRALSTERIEKLGLGMDTSAKEMTKLSEKLASLPPVWQEVYVKATRSNKTSEQIEVYLDSQRDKLGKLPPLLEQLYSANHNRLITDQKNQELAIAASNESARYLALAKDTTLSLNLQKDYLNSNTKRLAEIDRELVKEGNTRTQVSSLQSEKAILLQRQTQIISDVNVKEERAKDYLDRADREAAKQLEIQSRITGVTSSTISTVEDVKTGFENIKQQNAASQAQVTLLEEQRKQAIASSNQQYVLNAGLDKQIYEEKIKQANDVREYARKELEAAEGYRGSIVKAGVSYEELAKILQTDVGQAFIKEHEQLKQPLEELITANKDAALATQEYAQSVRDAAAAYQQRLQAKEQSAALGTQSATQTLNESSNFGKNPADDAREQTRIILEEYTKRKEAHAAYVSETIAKEDEIRTNLIRQVGETEEVNKNYYTAKRDLLTADVAFHKGELDKLLTDEQAHLASVRALKEELNNSTRSDLEFDRELYKSGLNEYSKLELDRVNAVRDATSAIALLKEGDYKHGKELIDSAIQDQQAYVLAIKTQEQAGKAAQGSTQQAYEDLEKMRAARNEGTQKQAEIEQQAANQSKEAAKAELEAIQQLTSAIERLSELLSKAPKLDVGVKEGTVESIRAVTDATKEIDSSAQSAARSTDQLKGSLEGIGSASKSVKTLNDEILKVVDSTGGVTYTTASLVDNLDKTIVSSDALTKSTGELSLEQKGLDFLTKQASQAALDASKNENARTRAVNELGESIGKLDNSSANPAINIDVETPRRKFIEVEGKLVELDNSSANPTVNVTADKALQEINSLQKDINDVKQGLPPELQAQIKPAEDKLNELKTKIDGVKQENTPEVKIIAEQALATVKSLRGSLEAVANKEVTVQAFVQEAISAIRSVQNALRQLQDKTVTVTTRHRTVNETVNKADGGYISGPGTDTSDSIPAMLSNGEFVIPAKAVRAVGLPFLERVRGGQKPDHFAGGGQVGTPLAADTVGRLFDGSRREEETGVTITPKWYTDVITEIEGKKRLLKKELAETNTKPFTDKINLIEKNLASDKERVSKEVSTLEGQVTRANEEGSSYKGTPVKVLEAQIKLLKEALVIKETIAEDNLKPLKDGITKTEKYLKEVQDYLSWLEKPETIIAKVLKEASRYTQAVLGEITFAGLYIQQNKDVVNPIEPPNPVRYASGGLVQGPGTGTSDSIPARLSAGEFVIPANAVEKVGVPFLERVRGFASGGYANRDYFTSAKQPTEDELLQTKYLGLARLEAVRPLSRVEQASFLNGKSPDAIAKDRESYDNIEFYAVKAYKDLRNAVAVLTWRNGVQFKDNISDLEIPPAFEAYRNLIARQPGNEKLAQAWDTQLYFGPLMARIEALLPKRYSWDAGNISVTQTNSLEAKNNAQRVLEEIKSLSETFKTKTQGLFQPSYNSHSRYKGRYAPGMASGGLVQGPGTGTSDSIPARLSAGEFVIPANAVEKVGVPFLERVRGFASGGLVVPETGGYSGEKRALEEAKILQATIDQANLANQGGAIAEAANAEATANLEAAKSAQDRVLDLESQLASLKGNSLAAEQRAIQAKQEAYDKEIKAAKTSGEKQALEKAKVLQYEIDITTNAKAAAEAVEAAQDQKDNLLGQLATLEGNSFQAQVLATKARHRAAEKQIAAAVSAGHTEEAALLTENMRLQDYLDQQNALKNKKHTGKFIAGLGYTDSFKDFRPGFSEGGSVTGNGTSTSDSIPARLSNGEFVVNAKAVQAVGTDFMEGVNSLKFANGGQVGTTNFKGLANLLNDLSSSNITRLTPPQIDKIVVLRLEDGINGSSVDLSADSMSSANDFINILKKSKAVSVR